MAVYTESLPGTMIYEPRYWKIEHVCLFILWRKCHVITRESFVQALTGMKKVDYHTCLKGVKSNHLSMFFDIRLRRIWRSTQNHFLGL
jgi:hypothetical protein